MFEGVVVELHPRGTVTRLSLSGADAVGSRTQSSTSERETAEKDICVVVRQGGYF